MCASILRKKKLTWDLVTEALKIAKQREAVDNSSLKSNFGLLTIK